MDHWYYADRKGQRQGPLPANALADLFHAGDVDAVTLVWREGMSEWQPLGEFIDELGLPGTALPPPLAGVSTGHAANDPAIALTQSPPIAANTVVFAGFWRRYLALVVDQLVLLIPLVVLALGLGLMLGLFEGSGEEAGVFAQLIYFAIYLVVAPLYYALQESSRHQATLGKRALGIKITDLDGNRLSFGKALGRWFAAALSYLTLYIGFLMAAFTQRKQALHDVVAGTLVTDHWAYTDHPERQKHGLSGCLVALLVVLVAGVPVLAILAAIALPAYQQYMIRAEVAQALVTAEPLKLDVSRFQAEAGRCPSNGEGTLLDAGSYATDHVSGIEVGPMQEGGRCALQVSLQGMSSGDLDGKRIWLEQDATTGTWHCSSEVEDRNLPSSCRG